MENIYERSKIYKLQCNDGNYYIGGTIEELNIRFNKHKSLSRQLNINKIYSYCNNVGWDNITIELIENYPCISKKELNKRINHYISENRNDNLCLNYFEIISDYQKGKIYKLKCNDGHYYIGSTIESLKNRFRRHKSASKTQTSNAYKHINIIGWDNVTIELLECYPCKTKDELQKKEDEYIKKHLEDPLCLNEHRSYLTIDEDKEKKKQYYEEHKQETLEYQQQYREANKEKIQEYFVNYRQENAEKRREYSKEYVEKNKEKVKEARRKRYENNKEKELRLHKIYVEQNKEKVNTYKKEWAQQYKETHAEEIAEERAQKQAIREEKKQARIKHDQTIVSCECGGSYQPYRKNRHLESKKHQHFMENNHV
jgi:hypothetical protein